MKRIVSLGVVLVLVFSLKSCSGVKILSSWKGDTEAVASFKEKNILVIARTADNGLRLPFEIEIANSMRANGFKAREGIKKVPNLHPEKDKSSVTSKSNSGLYMSGGFGSNYSRFGGTVPLSTSTYTTTTYVLETVAYNLDAGKKDQLIAIVTAEVSNPKDAYKTAATYTSKIMEALQSK